MPPSSGSRQFRKKRTPMSPPRPACSLRIVLATDRDSNRKFRKPIIREGRDGLRTAIRLRVTGRSPADRLHRISATYPAPAHTGGESASREPGTPLILRQE